MRRALSLLTICAAATLAADAAAEPRERTRAERAQDLFDVAMKMIDAGDYKPACPLLQQSDELDPGIGTRFRLAECYEKVGRLGSAWRLFTAVAEASRIERSTDREQVARQRAAALERKLPRIVINVPGEVGLLVGLNVRLEGERIFRDAWGTPLPADLGEQTVEVTATGKKPWSHKVQLDAPAQSVTVDVAMLEDAPPEAAPPPPPPPPPSGPFLGVDWTPQRIGAVAAAGAGVVGLVLGIAYGGSAASRWSEAQETCQDGDFTRCSQRGVRLAEDASSAALVSTIGFAIGAAGLGAGAYLWFTAPREEQALAKAPARSWVLVPAVGPGVAAGVLRARF